MQATHYVPEAQHPINPSQATKLRSVGYTIIHDNLRAGGTPLSNHKTQKNGLNHIASSIYKHDETDALSITFFLKKFF